MIIGFPLPWKTQKFCNVVGVLTNFTTRWRREREWKHRLPKFKNQNGPQTSPSAFWPVAIVFRRCFWSGRGFSHPARDQRLGNMWLIIAFPHCTAFSSVYNHLPSLSFFCGCVQIDRKVCVRFVLDLLSFSVSLERKNFLLLELLGILLHHDDQSEESWYHKVESNCKSEATPNTMAMKLC